MRCQPFAILFALASVNAFAETTPTKVVDPTNSVLAKQGAATVEAIDVDAHLASMPMGDRSGYIDSPKRIEQLLSHLLMRRNMAIEARELGLDKDPIVQREIEQAAETVLLRHRLDYIRDHAVVPDLTQLAREKFLSNSEAFKAPETVSVAHILLDTKKRTEAEARAQLAKWRSEIQAGATTIEDLAKANSDDPGLANNGGLYEKQGVDSFVQPFADAVRGLKQPGDLSDIVQTEFGFHLIQLKGREPAKSYAFDDIKEQLVAAEREKFIKQLQGAHVEKLKNLPIEAASPETIGPLRDRYGVPALKVTEDDNAPLKQPESGDKASVPDAAPTDANASSPPAL